MTATKLAKLILKRHSLVMLLLVLNVCLHIFHQGRADGKRSVACLPGKIIASRKLALQPLARFGLSLLDYLHHGIPSAEPDQCVDVVLVQIR